MKRTAYVADITGQAILHVLYEQLMKHHETVDRYEEWFVDLAAAATTPGAAAASSRATSAPGAWRRSPPRT